MKWKNQINDLQAFQPGQSIEDVKNTFQLESVVKLSTNENPYGCSEKVMSAVKECPAAFSDYPDGYASGLRKAVAEMHGVNPSQLIFANGLDELIQLISRALLEPGKNTVMATPTFPEYKLNAVIEGAEVREISLLDGAHDLDRMKDAIDEATAAVWLCSPNNPTGIYIPEKDLISFLKSVPEDVLIVLDEAYVEYAENPYHSLAFLEEFTNVIIMRTFSKIYGLAGFRVGYGISSEAVIQRLEPARPPFNTNLLGQIAAKEALSDQAFIADCKRKNSLEKEKYYNFCHENALSFYPTEGNFILMDVKHDGDKVSAFLLSKGVIIRSCKAMGFPTCLRVTIGKKEQNEQVRSSLLAFLNSESALTQHV